MKILKTIEEEETAEEENRQSNEEILYEENESLKERLAYLRHENKSLKFQFNKIFLQPNMLYVTLKYAETFLLYQHIKDIAIKEAERKNKGKGMYDFLFKTNAPRFAKAFKMKPDKAKAIIDRLTKMGAWEFDHIEGAKKVYVYKIGERRRSYNKYKNISFVFNWNNTKTKLFYKEELSKMGYKVKYQPRREELKKTLKELCKMTGFTIEIHSDIKPAQIVQAIKDEVEKVSSSAIAALSKEAADVLYLLFA